MNGSIGGRSGLPACPVRTEPAVPVPGEGTKTDAGFRTYCKKASDHCTDDACCSKYWTVSEENDDCRICKYITLKSGKKRCGLNQDKAGDQNDGLCEASKAQLDKAVNKYEGWEGGITCGGVTHSGEETDA